jgi:hypothetical protein
MQRANLDLDFDLSDQFGRLKAGDRERCQRSIGVSRTVSTG